MSAPAPPPRRLPDVRTDMDRVRQIIRHQALGHAVRLVASTAPERVIDVAQEFAHWIETGEQP